MKVDLSKILRPQTISTPHAQDLEKSKISREAAMAAGIATVPPNMISKLLGVCNFGWAAPQIISMLAFPYPPVNGGGGDGYFRVRVYPEIRSQNGAAKYLQPEGSTNHVYCPPGVDLQGSGTLYITEGEKKALCLTSHGFLCVGLGGVYGWRSSDPQRGAVIPDFEAINWRKRDVIIVFDADIAINENVAQAEAQLATELVSRKARVFIKRLPYGPGCAKGADDFIAAHGVEAFRKLPSKPVKPRKASSQAQTKAEKADPQNPLAGSDYLIEKGCFCYTRWVGSGEKATQITIPLCNFVAQATKEILRDDGVESSREFHIEGALGTGQRLPMATVKAAEFRGMSWVNRTWGLCANVGAGSSTQDRVRECIQLSSRGAEVRTIFTHSGFRKINGIWCFLHAGGALGGPEEIQVDLGPAENCRYHLPNPGGREASEASLRLLDIAPLSITAPLLASIYLAPLADMLKVDFTLWLLAISGHLKSTIAALFLSHFGDFERTTLPGQWTSTANSLEMQAFTLGGLPFVVDDYAPLSDSRRAAEQEAKAHRLIRGVGNRSARGRLSADLKARRTFTPRCFFISTGEYLPTGQSLAARYFVIEPDRKTIDMGNLTEAQASKHLLAQAMAAHIIHLARDLDEIMDRCRDSWDGYRQAAIVGGHLRVPEMVAWLAVGFELCAEFMVRMGVLDVDGACDLQKEAWQTFMELGRAHSRRIEGESPTLNFLNVLRELIIQKRVYFRGTDGNCPAEWAELGWQAYDEPPPYGELIGWVDADDGYFYLMPEATFRATQKSFREQGAFLGVSKNSLLKALAFDGVIEPDESGENTRLKWIAGSNRRVSYAIKSRLLNDPNGNHNGT